MAEKFEERCIISGIGQSEVGRRMTKGVLALTLDACLEAIADAGLTPADIDGVISWPGAVTRAEGLAPPGPGSSGPGPHAVMDAPRRVFVQGSVHEHVTAHTRGNRHAPVDDRREHSRRLRAGGVPVRLQAQRIHDRVRARAGRTGTGGREALGPGHRARPRDDAVDVGRGQAGIGDRLEACVQGQREHALGHAAPYLRLANPGDDAALFELLGHGHAGLNTGTNASPCSRNSTCTGMSIATSSAEQPTMFVMRRKSLCSSS